MARVIPAVFVGKWTLDKWADTICAPNYMRL